MTHNYLRLQAEQTAVYHIAISGRLPNQWIDYFDGFQTQTYTADGREHTLLTGPILDQANLHGLIATIQDLNLPLLAIFCDQFTYPFLQGDSS